MRDIVINTGPIIALLAATRALDWLPSLYGRILIPFEVYTELEAGGSGNAEIGALESIRNAIQIGNQPSELPLSLLRELDPGEASVIHTAECYGIGTVAIDERAGRRIARIHGLKVTGSLGILIRAKHQKIIPSLRDCISDMRFHGIWISSSLETLALQQAGEL